MKDLTEFLKESSNEEDKEVYVVKDSSTGIMFNFYYDKKTAEEVADNLNNETKTNNAVIEPIKLSELQTLK